MSGDAQDRVVEIVAGALQPELRLDWSGRRLDWSEARRLASTAVNAMVPDGSVLTEQCGIEFSGGLAGTGADRVSLVGNCDLAERIMAAGSDVHVHRFLLATPWRPQPRRRPSPRPDRGEAA